jgi:SAM-dependent methyltransferase
MLRLPTGLSARTLGLALALCGLAACGSDRGTEALQEPEAEAAEAVVPETPLSEDLEAGEVEAGEVAEVAAPEVESAEADADPGPGVDVYMGREVAQTMHWLGAEWLLRDTREDEEHVKELLGCLGVEAGDVVCDFGSGVGVHALPLAGLVGETGKVIAVDIQPQMLRMLEERAAEAGISGIETVSNGPASTGLAPDSVDLILLVDVYHELSHPEPVLAGLRRSLKAGGRVALVEFRGEDPAVPIKPEHKMTREQARLEWEANGFALVASYDELPWQHVLFFEVAEDS